MRASRNTQIEYWTLLRDSLVAIAFGSFASVVIWEFWFVPWSGFAVFTWRSYSKRIQANSRSLAARGLLVGPLAFATVIFAAARYEPTKTISKVEKRRIDLPSNEIQLGDLAWMAAYERARFPVSMRIAFPQHKRDLTVRLRSRRPTVGELLDTLKERFDFGHEYRGCLNGTSVLTGPNAAFGLHISDPISAEPQFDVEVHNQLLWVTQQLSED